MGFVLIGVLIIGAIAYVGGGSTVDGFGHDLKRTGEKIEQKF